MRVIISLLSIFPFVSSSFHPSFRQFLLEEYGREVELALSRADVGKGGSFGGFNQTGHQRFQLFSHFYHWLSAFVGRVWFSCMESPILQALSLRSWTTLWVEGFQRVSFSLSLWGRLLLHRPCLWYNFRWWWTVDYAVDNSEVSAYKTGS